MTQEELKSQFDRLATDLKQSLDQSVANAIGVAVKSGIQAIVETEREYTSRAIQQAIIEARCQNCPTPREEEKEQVRHLLGCIRDLGQGELDDGIRELRANHVWTAQMRKTQGWVSKTFLGGMIVIMASGVAAIVVAGFRAVMRVSGD